MARRLEVRILPAALVIAACASASRAHVDPPPAPAPPPAEPVVLASPLPFRVGITRWEPGPLTEALALRLRSANIFTEVYYPLESSAEMDAAIEFDVHRTFESDATAGQTALAILTMGMSESTVPARYRAIVRGELSLRVGERTLRKLETTVRVYLSAVRGCPIAAAREAADKSACERLAAQLVEELARDPTLLASDIAKGPEVSAP